MSVAPQVHKYDISYILEGFPIGDISLVTSVGGPVSILIVRGLCVKWRH
jgi:hypothetical protein